MKYRRPAETVEAVCMDKEICSSMGIEGPAYLVTYPDQSQRVVNEAEFQKAGFVSLSPQTNGSNKKRVRKSRERKTQAEPPTAGSATTEA